MFKLKKRGFTLIEILIVVSIIAILATLAMFMTNSNLLKSRDSKRKGDLDRLKIAFEEYYVDQNSYPPDTILSTCGSDSLKPYLSSIPCDPKTKQPYCYVYDASFDGQNYRLLSTLEATSDPIIAKLGCDSQTEYCGFETECNLYGSGFNYGVSSSNVVVASENIGSGTTGTSPTPTPSSVPLPSTVPGIHACDSNRVCNNFGSYQNAINSGCSVTWADDQCDNLCSTITASALCNH